MYGSRPIRDPAAGVWLAATVHRIQTLSMGAAPEVWEEIEVWLSASACCG